MVRFAQHAPRGARRRASCAATNRESRRTPAGGFSGDLAGVAREPTGSIVRRRIVGHQVQADRFHGSAMTDLATLKVWRGVSPGSGHFETFVVPFEPGQSVLDGLRWIRACKDPTLAIRFSCINANACKECMIEIDGKTVYACTTRLTLGEMTLKPLPNKRLVRYLVKELTRTS